MWVDVAEAVEEGVLLGVFEAGKVAVGSGALVAVDDGVKVGALVAVGLDVTVAVGTCEGVLVGVFVNVGVIVDGLPVKVKDPEVFHLLPTKICTS